MNQRVNPKQIVLIMSPKECSDCKRIQYIWFKTTEELNEWTCPECNDRIESYKIDVD